jgi:hypothetical protein
VEPSWTINIYLKTNEGQEGKIGLSHSRDVYQWEVGKYKEMGNKDEYSGCILYSHMKIKE